MSIPPDRLAAVRADDRFIVSYPRSGNTWMRHLVRNAIVLARPELEEPPELWMLIPDIHIPQHAMEHEAHAHFGLGSRILKSHNLRAIGGRRLLYVFREPADSLVSYYHFHCLQDSMREMVEDGLAPFCERMAGGWADHVEMALDFHARAPGETMLVSYEEMTRDTPGALEAAMQFLGHPVSRQVVEAAIEKASFKKLREKEEAKREKADEYFFRKGKVGSGKEELAPAAMEKLAAATASTYQRAVAAATRR